MPKDSPILEESLAGIAPEDWNAAWHFLRFYAKQTQNEAEKSEDVKSRPHDLPAVLPLMLSDEDLRQASSEEDKILSGENENFDQFIKSFREDNDFEVEQDADFEDQMESGEGTATTSGISVKDRSKDLENNVGGSTELIVNAMQSLPASVSVSKKVSFLMLY